VAIGVRKRDYPAECFMKVGRFKMICGFGLRRHGQSRRFGSLPPFLEHCSDALLF